MTENLGVSILCVTPKQMMTLTTENYNVYL